jgi:hypothetical protein
MFRIDKVKPQAHQHDESFLFALCFAHKPGCVAALQTNLVSSHLTFHVSELSLRNIRLQNLPSVSI